MAFKLDVETSLNMYGSSFRGTLHLKDFIDLETGKFNESFLEEKTHAKIEKETGILVEKYFGTYHSWSIVGNRYANGALTMKQGDELNVLAVKTAIEKKNKTTKEIADYLEVSEATVKKWLNKKSRPYVWNAMMLALYLNIDSKEIIVHEEI